MQSLKLLRRDFIAKGLAIKALGDLSNWIQA